jgi:glycosyltransferase involved in cell wall biosynthesis
MNNKNILFNALIMTGDSFGYASVITSYLSALAKHINNSDSFAPKLIIVCQKRAVAQLVKYGNVNSCKNYRLIVLPNIQNVFLRSFVEQFFLNILAIVYQCKIIHMPATLGLIFCLKKQLLFFHASTTFKMPRSMHGRTRLATFLHNLIIKHSASTATVLAVTANATANELFDYLGHEREFIVLGDGVKSFEIEKNPRPILAQLANSNYILYVSSFYGLKNQKELILAFLRNKSLDNFSLILVGAPAQRDYFEDCINLSKTANNISILSDINDDELGFLYKNCTLYVNPSLFEGFSLSPLEALSFGKPILLSDIPVHREIYGDNFQYFTPTDSAELIITILNCLNSDYKNRCLSLSEKLLSKYSWENFAHKNIQIYKDMVS